MRVNKPKMRRSGSAGGSRIRRGDDGDDEKLFAATAAAASEETSTSSSSFSAAARLAAAAAAAAPTTRRRRRTVSTSAPEREKTERTHLLALSLPRPLRKLFGGRGGGGASKEEGYGKKPKTKNNLAHYDELPDFLKDNDFVRSWYRRESSPRAAVASLWRLHNETGNIWSHALGEFEVFFFLFRSSSSLF